MITRKSKKNDVRIRSIDIFTKAMMAQSTVSSVSHELCMHDICAQSAVAVQGIIIPCQGSLGTDRFCCLLIFLYYICP